jgi:signal transduction histidine kinase
LTFKQLPLGFGAVSFGPDNALERSILVTYAEMGAAVRHEALNRLERCNLELMRLLSELDENREACRRLVVVSDELSALGRSLDNLRRPRVMRPDRPERMVLSEVLSGTVKTLQPRLEGVQLDETGTDLTVEGNPEMLGWLFLELFRNSLASFERARRKRRRIRVAASVISPTRCRILFQDNGAGIDFAGLEISPGSSGDAVSERIFAFGVSSTGSLGFGLPMAQRLLGAGRGSIVFDPSPAGAQFAIELPTARGPR